MGIIPQFLPFGAAQMRALVNRKVAAVAQRGNQVIVRFYASPLTTAPIGVRGDHRAVICPTVLAGQLPDRLQQRLVAHILMFLPH
jgi:hypothetical protein